MTDWYGIGIYQDGGTWYRSHAHTHHHRYDIYQSRNHQYPPIPRARWVTSSHNDSLLTLLVLSTRTEVLHQVRELTQYSRIFTPHPPYALRGMTRYLPILLTFFS